jgi:hypothetical protein
MTNLGIRRWLAIRRWPPLFLANRLPNMLTDPIHGPRWWIDLIASAVGITLIVTVLGADAYLTRRASRLVGIRSRPMYLLMAAFPLAVAVGCFIVPGSFQVHHPRLTDVLTAAGFIASWSALLALGRALTWGNFRYNFWVYPPAGRPVPRTSDVTKRRYPGW